MDILELKNTVSKIKGSAHRLDSKMEVTGKESVNLKDRTIAIMQVNNREKVD